MQIAYLISAHTDAPQLKRLIEALHPKAEFFIHIDKKAPIDTFARTIKGPNIHFIPQRVDVVWGTLVEVEYQMNLLRAAVAYPKYFDHIFFLSGMDYPLWSNERITRWLEAHAGEEILQGYCMDNPQNSPAQHTMYTVARPFSRCRRWAILQRILRKAIGLRKPLRFTVEGDTWKLYKGSAWWCISEKLASHLINCYEHKPEIRQYFRDSFGPAETLIQTIAFNSPKFRSRCLITEEGPYPGLPALTPLHFIEYDPVIKVMDETDHPRLMESGKMFCRKVVSGKSDALVEMLEERA